MALTIAAVVVAGLGGSAVALREAFLIRFHLYRLRQEPSRVVDLLQEPGSTVEYRAAQKFLELPAGKKALLRAYLEMIVGNVEAMHGDVAKVIESYSWTSGLVVVNSSSANLAIDIASWGPARPLGSTRSGMRPVESRDEVRAVIGNLEALEGPDLSLPEFPEVRFTILRGDRARESAWMPRFSLAVFRLNLGPGNQRVCRIRALEPLAVQALLDSLTDANVRTRPLVLEALGRLGCASDEVIAALEKLIAEIDGKEPGTRRAALDVLEKLREERQLEHKDSKP